MSTTTRYRLFLWKYPGDSSDYEVWTVRTPFTEKRAEQSTGFLRWIGEWQEVTV